MTLNPSEYERYTTASRRGVILKITSGLPAQEVNSSVLHTLLGAAGFAALREQVKEDVRWLQARELLAVETVGDGSVLLARLTERGVFVLAGRIVLDGVLAPVV